MLRLLVIGISVAILALGITVVVGRAFISSSAPVVLDLMCWQWSDAHALSKDDGSVLAALPVAGCCQWVALVTNEQGRPVAHARGGPITNVTWHQRWAVVRLDTECVPYISTNPNALVACMAEIYARVQREGRWAGLQIDADVPTRHLRDYALLLHQLRASLPPGTGLSCTALVDWLASADLDQVVAAVDWWVPQCYSTDCPSDPARAIALVSRIDVAEVARAAGRLMRPFRVGLPSYEQATLWDASDHLRAAALPIALEQALEASLPATWVETGPSGERLVRCAVPAATSIAGRDLPAGSTLLIGEPTVASLHAQLAAVRAAGGPCCLGVCLFRLSDPEGPPALSLNQVRESWMTVPPLARPVVAWHCDSGPSQWSLTVSNAGYADAWYAPTPLTLAVEGPVEALTPTPGILSLAALGEHPVAPAHASGTLLVIRYLRAGSHFSWRAVGPAPLRASLVTGSVQP